MTTCTRCGGTGFLNIEQVPDEVDASDAEAVMAWLDQHIAMWRNRCCSCHIAAPCSFCRAQHDVAVCDCCGDGETHYGEPENHYGPDDPPGNDGPYAGNGGLCQCH